MKLPSIPFTVLDTETTGFIPRVNRVIEFASVRYRDGKEENRFEELIAIESEIPAVVQVLTRILPDTLQGKPTFDERRSAILEHIGENTLIVGQNVGFDIRMLKGEGIDLSERPWIDTSMLASLVFPELASYSLGYVSSVLKLNHEPVHRALGDVRATLELFARCWERLLELPSDLQVPLRKTMERSSLGYQMLFSALPKAKKKAQPTWLTLPTHTNRRGEKRSALGKEILSLPQKGKVRLVEEPVDPTALQSMIDAACADKKTVHWIAVKNLEATVRRLTLSNDVRILYPPFLLLDPQHEQAFLNQDAWTDDEATLATKLQWFHPRTTQDLHLHGGEDAVWNGKLCCTEESAVYREQFEHLPSVILLDHRQLLRFLADPEQVGHRALTENAHIIIDDASMLEDTATKAYGTTCVLDTLRAASRGTDVLTKLTDIVQLWVEKTRAFQDLHYLTKEDLESKETRALREQIEILKQQKWTAAAKRHLTALALLMNPENLPGNISWIEQRQDGAQFIQSVPERVGALLQKDLYARFRTTLLIPPGSSGSLREILPGEDAAESPGEVSDTQRIDIAFPENAELGSIFGEPPAGKTVILVTSRRSIEDIFVKYTEVLEEKGITLICQNMSGGQSRMQAEFTAAESPVIWVLTPWTFEGIELPPLSIDHLMLQTLPFDHPSHAVISKRSEHYANAFMDYSLPRLLHRLYRLLRTFCRYRTENGDVQILDERIRTKRYGKEVREYLEMFVRETEEKNQDKEKDKDKDRGEQMPLKL